MTNKIVLMDTGSNPVKIAGFKIAIHLHVYYIEMLKDYMTYFNAFDFEYDIYITTDSIAKKESIETLINNDLPKAKIRQIYVFENIGRDILPWLKISSHLNKYDLVGHFHTKKTVHAEDWFGTTWYNELLEHLLGAAPVIIDTFMSNPKIGVVIPEIPACYHIRPQIYSEDYKNHRILNSLWKRMGCKKEISFDKLLTVIMPYGNMFWYRPDSLKQLFAMNLSTGDFPKEPLANDGTIAHCLERLIVYISWENNYDFRIIAKTGQYHNCFSDNWIFNGYIQKIKNSKTYRIGQAALLIPKMLKSAIKR
jgi:rhamnosyltransferase